jgi:hypothetical protein
MNDPHRIRLRGPWQSSSSPDGRTIHSRHFGKPTQLDSWETVWLIVDGLQVPVEILLNQEPLLSTTDTRIEIDITERLQLRNRLEIVLDSKELIGEVMLEIRQNLTSGMQNLTPHPFPEREGEQAS